MKPLWAVTKARFSHAAAIPRAPPSEGWITSGFFGLINLMVFQALFSARIGGPADEPQRGHHLSLAQPGILRHAALAPDGDSPPDDAHRFCRLCELTRPCSLILALDGAEPCRHALGARPSCAPPPS